MPPIEVSAERAPVATVGVPRTVLTLHDGGRSVGQARISNGNDASTIELSVAGDEPDLDRVRSWTRLLLEAALDDVAADGGGAVHWWVPAATDDDTALAHSRGLQPGRRLLQMRRPLPTGLAVDVATRAFRPGVDEAAWVEVNNRAFAGHPEQGGWTIDTVRRREAEPWFDPAGFRLHERDGRLAAFCWTKLHPPDVAGETLGEIYVIGVDPDFQGLGLGHQLTLAGLESISARGVTTGMLYVDAANTAAVAMYERLGFVVHHVDRAFTGLVASKADT